MKGLFESLHNFEEYSRLRNFSPSLKKVLVEVIKESISKGDGMIWTDNLLGELLKNSNSKIFNYLSEFPGVRGTILVDKDLRKGKYYTQDLVFEPSFHSNIDALIREFNALNPHRKIDENKLVEIEIQNAINTYGHSFQEIESFVDTHVYSIQLSVDNIPSIRDLLKFQYALTNILILSRLCNIHPFDIFEKNNNYILPKAKYFKNRLKIFLLRIRDTQNISIRVISNNSIDKIVNNIDELYFQESILINNTLFDRLNTASLIEKYNFNGFNLTSTIENYGGSIFALGQFFDNNSSNADSLWPYNENFLIYLKGNKLKIALSDNYGGDAIGQGSNKIITNLDLIKSNPIWNETIIENFEYLINKENVKEKELQLFFEAYPQLLLTDLYTSLYPQITLIDNATNKLRPDFLLRKIDSDFVDIIEIKRPVSKKLHKTFRNQPIFIDELQKAIIQIKCYREWFQQTDNRKKIKDKYGVDGYEPTATIVIGRKNSFENETVKKRLYLNERINLLTYDDLLSLAKKRKRDVL